MRVDEDKRNEAANVVGVARLFANYVCDAIEALDMSAKNDIAAFEVMVKAAADRRYADNDGLHRIFVAACMKHQPGGVWGETRAKVIAELDRSIDDYINFEEEED